MMDSPHGEREVGVDSRGAWCVVAVAVMKTFLGWACMDGANAFQFAMKTSSSSTSGHETKRHFKFMQHHDTFSLISYIRKT
jgi:hypothetical protein